MVSGLSLKIQHKNYVASPGQQLLQDTGLPQSKCAEKAVTFAEVHSTSVEDTFPNVHR